MLLRAILCGRVWDGFLLGQAKTEEVPCRFCGGNGHSFWEWFQGGDAVRVEPPQPGVIHVHSAELGKPRVGPTQEPSPSCIWSRLPCAPEATQAVTKPWTLMRLCKRVLVVSVTVFGGDAPSVPRLHHKSSRSAHASSSWVTRFCATAVGRVETPKAALEQPWWRPRGDT